MTERDPSSWILTFMGEQFYPLAPAVERIHIEDIAHALGHLCRFNGHVRSYYSVAEHSLRVSHAVPAEAALWGLLHDAAEAYLGDVVRPLKHHTAYGEDYQRHEANLMAAICARFDLPPTCPSSVLRADHEQLQEEWRYLMDPTKRFEWRRQVTTMSPAQAELEFLNRYRELTKGKR
jgi:5'-deoxynucleotidase YfbR-like HD superfamily hydrolase